MTENRSKEQRIQQIVDAAIEEFLDKGYEKASMEGIARGAGLSKGGLYHHFSHKDEILIYSVKKLSEPVYPVFEKITRADSSVEGLKNFIADYLNYWRKNNKAVNFYFLAMIKAFQDKKMSEMFDYSQEVFPLLTEAFQRGIEKGEFKDHNPEARAVAMMSSLDGVLAYLLLDEKLSFEDIISKYQSVFIDDIRI